MTGRDVPSIAVWKFASCDGCQLSLLDCEDELLAVAGAVRIAHFPEASRAMEPGPWDISFVEGSVSAPGDVERLKTIRQQSSVLVTLGACATAGGVQALRNGRDVAEFTRAVYARPSYIETLDESTPIAAHVPVDYELRGCPISKHALLELIAALLIGRTPNLPTHSTCLECKLGGSVCVMVARGLPCLGPVTAAGCGALCPSFARGCYGCFGPLAEPNTRGLAPQLVELTGSREAAARLYSTFNTAAPAFRDARSDLVQLRTVPASRAGEE